jgi:hypothetical protein
MYSNLCVGLACSDRRRRLTMPARKEVGREINTYFDQGIEYGITTFFWR